MLTIAVPAAAYTYSSQVTMAFAGDVGGANNSGTLVIGNSTGRQVALDDNEIQARAANGGSSTLYLQHAGGDLYLGSGRMVLPRALQINVAGQIAASFEQNGINTNGVWASNVVGTTGWFDSLWVGAPGGAGPACFNSDGFLILCPSSREKKTDISALTSGLGELMAMRPVSFAWKDDGRRDVGFVAEDAAEVLPVLAVRDARGKVLGFNYQHYTAVVTRAVQEQQTTIEDLHRELASSRAELSNLSGALAERDREVAAVRSQLAELARDVAAIRRTITPAPAGRAAPADEHASSDYCAIVE